MSLCGLTLTLLEFGRAHNFLRSDNQDWNGPAIRSVCCDAAVEIRSQPWLALLKTLRKRRRPFIVFGLDAVSFQGQRDSEDAHGRHGFRLM